MEAAAVQPPKLARITSVGEAEKYLDCTLAASRIDLLLELGNSLVRLAEAASEDRTPGKLSGAFGRTRLPLLLKRIELSLTALDALGGRPLETVLNLVEQPALFTHHGSELILKALDEINETIRSESLTPRRARLSVQTGA